MRVALFSLFYANLYNKYDPAVHLGDDELLVIQLAAAFHDSGRQTEGVDIDDERSANIAMKHLTEWEVDDNYVKESGSALSNKDEQKLSLKSLIAKCVQCADSSEFARIGEFDPTYLDIYKEFNGFEKAKSWKEEILPKQLKAGRSLDEFNKELEELNGEMKKFIELTTQNRHNFSLPNVNYYSAMLDLIDQREFPCMHAMLVERKAIQETNIETLSFDYFGAKYTGQYCTVQQKSIPYGKGILQEVKNEGEDHFEITYEGIFSDGNFVQGKKTIKKNGELFAIEEGEFGYGVLKKLQRGKITYTDGNIQEGAFDFKGSQIQIDGWKTQVFENGKKGRSLIDKEVEVFVDDLFIENHSREAMQKLHQELQKQLKTTKIETQKERAALWRDVEKLAEWQISQGQFKEGMSIRMQAAQAFSSQLAFGHLQELLINEHAKFGIKLQPLDTYLFKNHTLSLQKRQFPNDRAELHINGKLSKGGRLKLQASLECFQSNPQVLFGSLPEGFCRGIRIHEKPAIYQGRREEEGKNWEGCFSKNISDYGYKLVDHKNLSGKNAKNFVIHFEGIGKVEIGNTSHFRTEFNRLSIELDSSVSETDAPEKLNIIFAALGLGAVSVASQEDDIERMKVLQLFRTFYPNKAFDFEKKMTTFQEPIGVLKKKIFAALSKPEEEQFKASLSQMYTQEVYPGQKVWAIDGLADQVKEKGGIGLMSGISAPDSLQAAERFASILKYGVLSTQDRYQIGVIAAGASAGQDFSSGGADSVFARLITRSMSKDPHDYPLSSKAQILYDLKVLERSGHVYLGDQYGTKDPNVFQNRLNCINFTQELEKSPRYTNNEVCIRNRVSPEFIKGVMVPSEDEKQQMIKILTKEGLVKQGCVNGISLDNFIHVGHFEEKYWA